MLKHLIVDGRRHDVTIVSEGDRISIREGERAIVVTHRRWTGARLELGLGSDAGARMLVAHILRGRGGRFEIWLDGERHLVEEEHRGAGSVTRDAGARAAAPTEDDLLTAPMPAKVVKVEVAPGDTVEEGQTLLVLESMKMELGVTSPRAGTVKRVAVTAGQMITAGTDLIELERATEPAAR